MIQAGKEALTNKKSVVADNTNPTVDARSNFVKLAKQKGKTELSYLYKNNLIMAIKLTLQWGSSLYQPVLLKVLLDYFIYLKHQFTFFLIKLEFMSMTFSKKFHTNVKGVLSKWYSGKSHFL